MATGKINVQTENIFPIIKKFLYSDHEIFLRELISNAVDATQKLKTLASVGEFKGELGDLTIEVTLNKKSKTIIISDRGIGLNTEEVEKYINQIAFSGAEEFVQKYKDKAENTNIIGHFGLGFYSSFMVSSSVEIHSLTWRDGSKPVKWECDGSPEYKLSDGTRKERGTQIVLHISDDSVEFLEDSRIEGLLKKYCKFLPVPIKFGSRDEWKKNESGKEEKTSVDNIINDSNPAWTKAPASLSDQDYKDFYRALYPMVFEDPLFHIHLNVDHPFHLTGILYFPRLKKTFEIPKDKIQLYCSQVFVTDSVENIVPDFLALLRGVIDSPDIPLNVSRSYLQSDSNVKKISAHITRKVADKLEELFKKDRSDFEAKWDDIKIFMAFGMISDEKFYERAQKFALVKNTAGKFFTLDEYYEFVKPIQTDKEKNIIYLYASNPADQHTFIEGATERGYNVLVMDSPLDAHLIQHLEHKLDHVRFARVDADTIDKLIKKDDLFISKITDEQQKLLKPIVEGLVPKEKFTVVFENLNEKDHPMIVTQPEQFRRMKEMSASGGGAYSFMGNMPDSYNLVVNNNHPLISKILLEPNPEKQKQIARQAADLALLSQNLLRGEELTSFIKRSVELIG